jgi:hypothetical protein
MGSLTPFLREESVLANHDYRNAQAHWLAQGYLQGQRDLLIKLMERKFDRDLPKALRAALDQVPAAMLESVGPLVLSAPDASSAIEAVEVFVE